MCTGAARQCVRRPAASKLGRTHHVAVLVLSAALGGNVAGKADEDDGVLQSGVLGRVEAAQGEEALASVELESERVELVRQGGQREGGWGEVPQLEEPICGDCE